MDMKKCEAPQILHHQIKCCGNLIVLKTNLVTVQVSKATNMHIHREKIGGKIISGTFKPLFANNGVIFLEVRCGKNLKELLTRELKEDVAEFESEYYTSYPMGSIGQTNSYEDLLLKTSHDCAKILEEKIVIYLLDWLHDVSW